MAKLLYDVYLNTRAKCKRTSHRQYPLYGGKGIDFKFDDHREFLMHCLPLYDEARAANGGSTDKLALVRINLDGHFEPGNVKFVVWTPSNQVELMASHKGSNNVSEDPITNIVRQLKAQKDLTSRKTDVVEMTLNSEDEDVDSILEGVID